MLGPYISDILATIAMSLVAFLLAKVGLLVAKRVRDNRVLSAFPGPDEHWLLGSIPELMKYVNNDRGVEFALDLARKFPKACKIRLGCFRVQLRLHHPDFIRTLLTSSEPKFDGDYKLLKPWIGDNLLNKNGHDWSRERKMMTPAFHTQILKTYITVFNECACVLVKKWRSSLESSTRYVKVPDVKSVEVPGKPFVDMDGERSAGVNGRGSMEGTTVQSAHGSEEKYERSVEVMENIGMLTLDSFIRCIFGEQGDVQNEGVGNVYLKTVKEVLQLMVERFQAFTLQNDFIYSLTWHGYKLRRACRILKDYASRVMAGKLKERTAAQDTQARDDSSYRDLMDIIMDLTDDTGRALSSAQVKNHVDGFLFAGHDTTSSGISWCLYSLSTHPDYQKKCREEVNQVLGDREEFTWEDLHRLPFLTMFIKESLRMYTTVPSISRETTKTLTFPDGTEVAKGIWVGISIYACHHHADFWENPDRFDPYRFTPENIKKRSPYAFIPFSAGPRNCLGQRFALNQMKIVVGLILRNFELLEDIRVPVRHTRLVLKAKRGLYVKLRAIDK